MLGRLEGNEPRHRIKSDFERKQGSPAENDRRPRRNARQNVSRNSIQHQRADTHSLRRDWPVLNPATAQIQTQDPAGGERVADFDEYGARWTTLCDPEGNLFDIGG